MAAIIPFFIHHQGCPHRCLFCDQNVVASASSNHEEEKSQLLEDTIDTWLPRFVAPKEVQLAFYGGSFTCLRNSTQVSLLSTVYPYIQKHLIHSIRVSTRPDCIDEQVCLRLREYGVKTVELGVQSLNDRVLEGSERGHSAADVRRASALLSQYGFSIGIQLMLGLPGDSTRSFLNTVRDVVDLQPAFVRIYPALVIKNTGLEKLYNEHLYRPLSLHQAIALTRRARQFFNEHGIEVIRMGLQPSTELEKQIVAGPYHQAFGELVLSRDWFRTTRKMISQMAPTRKIKITISDRDHSSFVGLKRCNIRRLERLFPHCSLEIETDTAMKRRQVRYAVD